MIRLLQARGAMVAYHDPFVDSIPEFGLRSVSLEEACSGADLAVIVTAHPGVDHDGLAGRVPCVVDLRGVTRARSGVLRL
jgi:UDP-N-acetyl-D-glucosamine dehydrogenase